MENYFNYFTEIEEHFLRRRGAGLLLSTLDWALIETWKDAEIPLEAVLRGIDGAFDKYDQRPSKTRKINGLAWCSQAILQAAEDMKEAAVGVALGQPALNKSDPPQGFDPLTIAAFLRRNAAIIEAANLPPETILLSCSEKTTITLRSLAEQVETKATSRLENLERHLTVLEEKLFAALHTCTPDEELVSVRAQADRELAPYRSKMAAPQIDQLQKQYLHKRLLEKYNIPRLSLFYM